MTTSQVTAPDGGWGWVIAFCSFANHIFLLGSITSFSVLYVSWLEEFDTPKSVTSWIISICTSVMFLSGPISSALASKLGYRVTTLIGGIVACSGLFLGSFASSVLHLMLSIGLITGFGYGLAYLSSLANVVIYFDRRRALATCIGTSGAGLGSFVMAPLLNGLVENYGWRGALLITGGLVLHICVTGTLMRPLLTTSSLGSVEKEGSKTSERLYQRDRRESSFRGEEIAGGNDKEEIEILPRMDHHVEGFRSENAFYEDAPPVSTTITQSDKLDALYYDPKTPRDIKNMNPHFYRSNYHQARNTAIVSDINSDLLECVESRRDGKISESNHIFHTPFLSRLFNCRNGKLNGHLTCCFNCITGIKVYLKSVIHKNKEVVKKPAFIFLAISQILICMSSIAPIVFIVDRALHNNIAKSSAVWLISIYGIGSISGRLCFGILADRCMTKHLKIYIIILTVSGIATVLSPLCGGSFLLNGMYAGVFGFCMGGVASLIILVIVDLMGLTKVSISLGLLLFCAGLGHAVGPPFGGFVYDQTSSYTLSYVCQGLFLTFSGAILLPAYCHQKRTHQEAVGERRESFTPNKQGRTI